MNLHFIHIEQGTGILFGMTCAIIALVGLLCYLADEVIRTKALLAEDADEREAEVLNAMLRQVGHILLAERLREIARNYESPDNVLLRRKISRTEWKEGGTPLPALWLMALADEISPEEVKTDYVDPLQPIYNLAGERFQP